jgi:hypothetical protein
LPEKQTFIPVGSQPIISFPTTAANHKVGGGGFVALRSDAVRLWRPDHGLKPCWLVKVRFEAPEELIGWQPNCFGALAGGNAHAVCPP